MGVVLSLVGLGHSWCPPLVVLLDGIDSLCRSLHFLWRLYHEHGSGSHLSTSWYIEFLFFG